MPCKKAVVATLTFHFSLRHVNFQNEVTNKDDNDDEQAEHGQADDEVVKFVIWIGSLHQTLANVLNIYHIVLRSQKISKNPAYGHLFHTSDYRILKISCFLAIEPEPGIPLSCFIKTD